jgi:hypothetical protein
MLPNVEARHPRIVWHVCRGVLDQSSAAGGDIPHNRHHHDPLSAATARAQDTTHQHERRSNDVHGHILLWVHARVLGAVAKPRGHAPGGVAASGTAFRIVRVALAIHRRPPAFTCRLFYMGGTRAVVDHVFDRYRRRRSVLCWQTLWSHTAHRRFAQQNLGRTRGWVHRVGCSDGSGSKADALATSTPHRTVLRNHDRGYGPSWRSDRLAAEALCGRKGANVCILDPTCLLRLHKYVRCRLKRRRLLTTTRSFTTTTDQSVCFGRTLVLYCPATVVCLIGSTPTCS